MVKKREPDVINEWTHFITMEQIGDREQRVMIEPDAEQKANLARRLDVVAVESLKAELNISPSKGGLIHIHGAFDAMIEQTCVVTLEPLHIHLKEDIEGWFSNQDQMVSFAKVKKDQQTKRAHAEVELLDESEDPETVVNGKIDLGELVTQHVSLAIDPYPHKEGAVHATTDEDQKVEKGVPRRNPFEALKDWKEKR